MAKAPVNYYAYGRWKNELINNVPVLDQRYSRDDWPDSFEVHYFISKFQEMSRLSEPALNAVFASRANEYSDDDYLYIKVSLLNDIYSTHLSSVEKDAIVSILSDYSDRLDANEYDEHLISEICNSCQNRIGKEPYSFITKYCSHQREDLYPIYDKYTCTMLRWYRDLRRINGYNDYIFNDSALKASASSYNDYKNVISDFLDLFHNEFTFKQIDMFLWCAGKNFFPMYVNEDYIPN